jgi:hypothetical protein
VRSGAAAAATRYRHSATRALVACLWWGGVGGTPALGLSLSLRNKKPRQFRFRAGAFLFKKLLGKKRLWLGGLA